MTAKRRPRKRTTEQPELLNGVQLAALLGVSNRALLDLRAGDWLPKPIALTPNSRPRWLRAEVMAAIAERAPRMAALADKAGKAAA